MDKSKVATAISQLHKKAIRGELEWTELENHRYQISFPNSTIVIGEYENEYDHSEYYSLRFINQRGDLILEIDPGNISQYVDATYKMLEEIYNSAKEQILNIDGTFDDIINALENPKSEPDENKNTVPEDDLPF
jgi:hypothetical protein